MTIQTEICKVVYEGDGTTKVFQVSFHFFEKEIAVYKNSEIMPLTEGTDYTVRNSENYYGGEIEFTTAPKAGDKITITRNVELKQLITFLEGEKFPASDYEYALDKITMGLQQLREHMSRVMFFSHDAPMTTEEIYQCLELLYTYSEYLSSLPELIKSIKKVYDTQINITASSLIATNEFANYPYKYNLALTEVSENTYAKVMFNQTDATAKKFAPFVKTYNGGITLYLKNNTALSTTIPLILLM